MLQALPARPSVILCTLNAKYIHASLGLRYLLANMGGLRAVTALCEFTLGRDPMEMAQALLQMLGPRSDGKSQVVGLGVYIWNVDQTCALVRQLRQLRPTLKIVLGGPEVSHECDQQEIVALADHVITGWGDTSFPKLCRALLSGPRPLQSFAGPPQGRPYPLGGPGEAWVGGAQSFAGPPQGRPYPLGGPGEAWVGGALTKIIAGEQPALDQITLPYSEYTDADLAHRLLYVEASRGCPFKCAFCLSALDKTAWAFDLENFLAELDHLHTRGARNFKFVDRTFNLKVDAALRILQFFLDRLPAAGEPGLFVHFEVIPDHLPQPLKDAIARFPPGVLQFEVGIQTFNLSVQQRISRRQDNDRTVANLRWLVGSSNAHLHADLIFGLPGEDLGSFGAGFDRLLALGPHEIQLGVLKRLRGTPITRLGQEHGMVYDPRPPYAVRQTAVVGAGDMQRFTRLARYWDLVANSGRFKGALRLLLGASAPAGPPAGKAMLALASPVSPFAAFLAFSDWLWDAGGSTSGITPELLVDRLFAYLHGHCGLDPDACRAVLLADYLRSGARARPQVLRAVWPKTQTAAVRRSRKLLDRQSQHQSSAAMATGGCTQLPVTDAANRL